MWRRCPVKETDLGKCCHEKDLGRVAGAVHRADSKFLQFKEFANLQKCNLAKSMFCKYPVSCCSL
jgi:hypothetical protein